MRILRSCIGILGLASAVALAGDFKPYPGATVDDKSSAEYKKMMENAPPEMKRIEASFYLTTDSFDKVYAFYKPMAAEYKMPGQTGKRRLPSGLELQEAFFIFDGAKELAASKLWLKVQRPYVGLDPKQTRDITAIVVTRYK